MACEDDDGHPFVIVFEIVVVPFAIQRQASPMACGDHHDYLFFCHFQGTKAFADAPYVFYALSFDRFRSLSYWSVGWNFSSNEISVLSLLPFYLQ